MKVVLNNDREFLDIAAIGIGHRRQDLVLVPAAAVKVPPEAKPIEIAPDEWETLVILK
jgi:hypothetical protein